MQEPPQNDCSRDSQHEVIEFNKQLIKIDREKNRRLNSSQTNTIRHRKRGREDTLPSNRKTLSRIPRTRRQTTGKGRPREISKANHVYFHTFIRGECTSCWSLRADTAAASFVYSCTRTVGECTACEHRLQYADKC